MDWWRAELAAERRAVAEARLMEAARWLVVALTAVAVVGVVWGVRDLLR